MMKHCRSFFFVSLLWGLAISASASNSDSHRRLQQQLQHDNVRRSSSILSLRAGGGMNKPLPKSAVKKQGRTTPTKKKMAPKKSKTQPKKASVVTSVFNLANNVAGAGILTLAAGKATGTGWIPSIGICVVLALVSSHTFTLIGKACELTDQTTFKGLWTDAFGASTAWIVDSMVFCQCFFVSIIYTGLLGDIFSALLQGNAMIPSAYTSRTSIIVLAATCILWPLNQIRDLSALGFTSILGLVAVLYTVGLFVVRSLDGTYSLPTATTSAGKFLQDIALQPDFTKSTWWNFDFSSLVLVSNLGLAFMSHYNGPTYWRSLEDATAQRFQKVSLSAYTILAMIYVTTMVAGYATFGDVCQGNILLNYAPSDILSTLGRLATGLSIIFGFPLISNGAREGLKNASSALGVNFISNPKHHVALVTCLLVITTSLAIVLKDIALIAGMTGALMGSSLVYICPTLIYSKIVQQTYGAGSVQDKVARRNLLLIPFGCFTAIMGVTMTLKNTVLAK